MKDITENSGEEMCRAIWGKGHATLQEPPYVQHLEVPQTQSSWIFMEAFFSPGYEAGPSQGRVLRPTIRKWGGEED